MASSKYLGNFQDSKESASKGDQRLIVNILKEAQRNASTPRLMIFYNKYKQYPCQVDPSYDDTTTYIPYSHILKVLKELNHDVKNDIITYTRSDKHNYKYVSSQFVDLGDGIMLSFTSGCLIGDLESTVKIEPAVKKLYHVFYGISVLHLPGMEEEVDKLTAMFHTVTMKSQSEAQLQMICKNMHGFYLQPIKIKKPLITDLVLHYGEGFESIHNTILEALKEDEAHGLILLHGLPGTGKTHYIRYLIQEISEKQLIYVPPDMASAISSPEFLPFMLQNANSVLIIEDAENIIRSRDSKDSTTQSVANLLNLSDGLLGDSLHQPIIATFNCEINSIDAALLRKGRLIKECEFGMLCTESCQTLSDKLGFTTKITEPMTLADIYGQKKE